LSGFDALLRKTGRNNAKQAQTTTSSTAYPRGILIVITTTTTINIITEFEFGYHKRRRSRGLDGRVHVVVVDIIEHYY
jgi:hypothetical protein